MLKAILNLIGLGGPEQEAKTLSKDAHALLDMIHGQHGAASLQKVAEHVRTHVDEVHRQGLNDPQFYTRGVEQLTELNKAARARRDNVAWSGITLAIIYVKAEMLGDLGLPARNAIDGFVDKWAHAVDDDANAEAAIDQAPAPDDSPD